MTPISLAVLVCVLAGCSSDPEPAPPSPTAAATTATATPSPSPVSDPLLACRNAATLLSSVASGIAIKAIDGSVSEADLTAGFGFSASQLPDAVSGEFGELHDAAQGLVGKSLADAPTAHERFTSALTTFTAAVAASCG